MFVHYQHGHFQPSILLYLYSPRFPYLLPISFAPKGAEPNSSLARLRAKARVNTDVIIAIKEVYMGEVTGISSFHGQTRLLHDSFTKV